MSAFTVWTAAEARGYIVVPTADDDKYSRGVLGMVTGSARYPGAAVIGAEAALHTGVGMVRYLGPGRASRLVLQRRPEVVTEPGRVQAWLLGSGMAAGHRSAATARRLGDAIGQGVPAVLDAGALDLLERASAAVIVTPHYRELGRLLGADAASIAADAAEWAARAARQLNVTVLLKGHTTYIASPGGVRLAVEASTSWLATAGTGDALGGILGALVATHTSEIAGDESLPACLAATASLIQVRAAERAGGDGPFTVLELAAAVSAVIAELLAEPIAE